MTPSGFHDAQMTACLPDLQKVSFVFFLLLYSIVCSPGQWDSHCSPNIVSKCDALLIILRKNFSVIVVKNDKTILKQYENKSMGLARPDVVLFCF